jgi:hypothetical protein
VEVHDEAKEKKSIKNLHVLVWFYAIKQQKNPFDDLHVHSMNGFLKEIHLDEKQMSCYLYT